MAETIQIKKVVVDPMPLERFWEIVELADWETNCEVHEGCGLSKRVVRKELTTHEDMRSFRARYDLLMNALSKVTETWERKAMLQVQVGSDGWSDLLAHVVGMGEHLYNEELASPEKVYQRARSGKFKESFSYAIPYDEEYDENYDELQRQRRHRDFEMKRFEDHLVGVLEPALNLAAKEATMLNAEEMQRGLSSVLARLSWHIRREAAEVCTD